MMQRSATASVLLLLGALVSSAALGQTGASLPNGSFEQADGGDARLPLGWTPPTSGADWATGVARTGTRSLHLSAAAKSDIYWTCGKVRVVPGHDLLLLVWARVADVTGEVYTKYYGGGNPPVPYVSGTSASLSATRDWTPLECRLTAPEGLQEIAWVVRLAGTGQVWFDDAAVVDLGPSRGPKLVAPVKLATDFPDRLKQMRAFRGQPSARGETSLSVHNLGTAAAQAYPVSRGVPFAQGQLGEQSTREVLDPRGKPVPSQSRTLATWPDGSVKWLLVSWAASVPAGGEARYVLRSAPAAKASSPPPVPQPRDGQVTLQCGRLQVLCRAGGRAPFDAVWVDADGDGHFSDTERVLDGSATGAWLRDATGKRFTAVIEPGGIAVEEQGLVRSVVKVQGWYVADDGARFCRHETRIYLHGGAPRLTLAHSWIFTGKPDTESLQGFGLSFVPGGSSSREALMGGLAGTHPLTAGPATLTQSDWSRFQVRDAAGQVLGEGGQAPGWLWTGGQQGMLLTCRDFAQTAPKALYASANECGIALWSPESGQPLTLKRHAPGMVKMPSHGGECALEDGVGVSKTHEIELLFGVPAQAAQSAALVALSPPVPVLDPQWVAASAVVGTLGTPSDCTPAAHRAEQLTADWLDQIRHAYKWYGMLNWGDFKESWYSPETDWADTKMRMFLWENDEIDMQAGPWTWVLHSGDPRAFAVAEEMTYHCRDVDTVQWDDRRPWRVGGTHRHDPQHWADMLGACHTFVDHNLLHYYLTGDRRSYETAVKTGDFCLANCDQHGLIIHSDPVLSPEQGGGGYGCFRDFGGAMHDLISVYQATWDRKYYDRMVHLLEFVCNGQYQDGRFAGESVSNGLWNGGPFNGFYTLYNLRAMWIYHRLTGDEQVKQTFLRGLDAFAGAAGYQDWALTLNSYAYEITGKAKYLAAADAPIGATIDRVDASPGTSTDELIKRWDYSCGAMIFLRDLPYLSAQRARMKGDIQAALDQSLLEDLASPDPDDIRPWRIRGEQKTFYWQRTAGGAPALVVRKLGFGPQSGDLRVTLAAPDGRQLFECKGGDQAEADWTCFIPPDPPLPVGVLRLDIASTTGGAWSIEPDTEKVVLDVRDWLILGKGGRGRDGARRYYFRVPEGTQSFAVALKGWKPGRVVACLLDPDSKVAATLAFDAGKPGEAQAEQRLTTEVGPGQAGKIWAFGVSFPSDIYVKLEGILPYFAVRRDTWFDPTGQIR